MNSPLVSVIMPTHNYGHFIKEAIEGFLDQTYTHFELIIVDDVSTDQTSDIVRRYRDDRIVLVHRETWSGGSGDLARNDGLSVAKGEFIASADADDISASTRLQQQVAFLLDNPDIDVVGGGLIPIFGTREHKGAPVLKPVFRDHPEYYRIGLLENKPVILNSTVMYRKKILEKLGGYKDFLACSDYEFLLRASRYFRFCNLNQVLIYARQHRRSATRVFFGARLEHEHNQIYLTREQLWSEHTIKKAHRAQPLSIPPPKSSSTPPAAQQSEPLVSIIMAVYNQAEEISESIKSLLKQIHKHFELIIIDDDSTDNTANIIHSFRDDRIKYVQHPEYSCSPDFVLNEGFAIAKGTFIAIASANNIYVPHRLSSQLHVFDQHPQIDILGSAIKEAKTPDNRSQILTFPVYHQPHQYRQDLLDGKLVMASSTMMFKKSILKRIQGYKDYPYGGDYEFLLHASRYFTLYNTTDVLARDLPQHQTIRDHTRHLHNVVPLVIISREYLWVQHEIEHLQHSKRS